MKRVLIIAYSSFAIIMLANYFYYKSLYKNQIEYIINLLDRQVQIVGLSVDQTNNQFMPDLNQIGYSEDLAMFFQTDANQNRAIERIKLFFIKYQGIVTGIKLYDNERNEFTLKRDETGEWLAQQFVLHSQGTILEREALIENNRRFEYHLPVLKDNKAVGNIVVTIDYKNYFDEIFTEFNLKDYQWQWVLTDSGQIIYDNNPTGFEYGNIDIIGEEIYNGANGNIKHFAVSGGNRKEIISSYYSTQLIQRDLGLVFSAPTEFFQKYIIRNSVFIVTGTMMLILVIIFFFWKYARKQSSENNRLAESEKMLFRLIEEMPVGVIIHNKNREIIKANRVAADQYSYSSEDVMKGKIFPEQSISNVSEYFSKNPATKFEHDRFIILKKEIGEMVLLRNSIPVIFKGEDATMEILIDITMLESARKQEIKANVAKSEFLARMSYEIRTPLNGIIGITDIISRHDLSPEIKEIVGLLRRSTEVLLNIINDILDFSKIEAGRMILDEVPFNLREELNYCSDLAKTYIADKNIEFIISVEERIPTSVIADPYRLRQILTNLIHNASRNTEKGKIKLACQLKANNSGQLILQFDISDTGTAFDKTSLKKIFGDFVVVDSKAVRSNDETGFSTILARQLAELMGGSFDAVSPSGLSGDSGTKVTFTITAYSNDRLTKKVGQESVISFDRLKVLAITGVQNRDEEVLSSFHKLGAELAVTTYQKSTINQIKNSLNAQGEKYKLILIIDDEDFDGFEAAEALAKNNMASLFIIMIISSNDKKGNYIRCVSMGVDHYIVKPFSSGELLKALRESFPLIDTSSTAGNSITDIKTDVRILVVEDNKMNQKVLGALLRTMGYKYDLVEDGYSAILQSRTKKYDLIFMDLVLPEMDGYESARRILSEDKNVLIVAFTADNMPEARRKAEMSGIRDFISKPVRIEDLKYLFSKHFIKA